MSFSCTNQSDSFPRTHMPPVTPPHLSFPAHFFFLFYVWCPSFMHGATGHVPSHVETSPQDTSWCSCWVNGSQLSNLHWDVLPSPGSISSSGPPIGCLSTIITALIEPCSTVLDIFGLPHFWSILTLPPPRMCQRRLIFRLYCNKIFALQLLFQFY